ncbi:hypothetical protein B566_EDAN006577 [Ephemera danica]|nr:hypothetical protein B566_EDAN006577 [Ephemera danica]
MTLDTRLSCLEPYLAPDSDPQRMINTTREIFDRSFDLELKIPFWKFFRTPTWRTFVKSSNEFLAISMKYIQRAKHRSKNQEVEMSVLQSILKRDPNEKTATIMAMDMMLAGINTTSSTAAFLLYNLARNPEKQEKLYEELCRVLPSKDDPLTAEKLDEMKYLKACIKESLSCEVSAAENNMHATSRTLLRYGPRGKIQNLYIPIQATASTVVAALQQESPSPKPYSEVPGPKPLPIIGNTWRFLPVIGTFKVDNYMQWASGLRDTYGEVTKITDIHGRRDIVFLFSPQDIEHVFRNEGQWPLRLTFDSFTYFRSEIRNDFFGNHLGLVFENGEKWQQARTAVNQPMMQPRMAKLFVPKIDQVAIDLIKRMASLRDEQNEMPVNFKNELHKWALESISLVALDTRLGCLEPYLAPDSDPQRMINITQEIFNCTFELDLKVPYWKYFSTPTWRTFVKSSQEFLKVLPSKDDPLTAEKLDEMRYLKACIKESMRLSPIVPGTARILDKDLVLSNKIVPKGTEVVMFLSTLYRMEKYFPQANTFIPERWLRGETGCPVHMDQKAHPFVFLPFGHGPRQCVGMRFANLELESLLVRVVREYKLEWHHEDMVYSQKTLNTPAMPLRYRLINRY